MGGGCAVARDGVNARRFPECSKWLERPVRRGRKTGTGRLRASEAGAHQRRMGAPGAGRSEPIWRRSAQPPDPVREPPTGRGPGPARVRYGFGRGGSATSPAGNPLPLFALAAPIGRVTWTLNPLVVGSIPTRPTNRCRHLASPSGGAFCLVGSPQVGLAAVSRARLQPQPLATVLQLARGRMKTVISSHQRQAPFHVPAPRR